VAEQPGNGEIYCATDGRWYRWPNPTPYPSRDAAEAREAWAVMATPAASPAPLVPAWYGAPQPPTGVARATAYLAALLLGVPVLGGAVAWLVLPHSVRGGGCEGIGFGCTLSPANTAILVAFYVLLFTVPGVALAALAMRGLTSVWPWYREAKALVKAVVVVGLFAAPLLLIRVVGLLFQALVD